MRNPHLGRRVHDLLDGRLSPAETYAAMAHLGECAPCSQTWHELRHAREALNSSDVGIDMSFAQQLLDRERMAAVASSEPARRRRAAKGRSRAPFIAGVSAMALVMSTLTAAYVIGAPSQVSLEFVAAPAGSNTQTVAYHGPDNMRSDTHLRSWIHPDWSTTDLIPVEARVVQRSGQPVLVASMVADMHQVIVTEQHGRLHASAKEELPTIEMGDRDVLVVSYDPPMVVWESSDVVISARCECPIDTLEEVVEAFPADAEPSVVDRIAAGLDEMADAITGQ